MELGYNYEWLSPSHLLGGGGGGGGGGGEGVMCLCTCVCCVNMCECVLGGGARSF